LGDTHRYTDLLYRIKPPLSFLGVSVENNSTRMQIFFQAMKQRSEFILVRDQQSKHYLNNHYKVVVGHDLSFLYPFAVVATVKEELCGINMREWHYWQGTLHGSIDKIMRVMDRRYPWVRRIYPFAAWNSELVAQIVKNNFELIIPFVLNTDSNNQNDWCVLSRFFNNVHQEFESAMLSKMRYLIGMRYHAIVFAVQAGIPFISLSYQPKNLVFCQESGCAHLSVGVHATNKLPERIAYLKNNYQPIRQALLDYRAQCVREMQRIAKSVLRLFC